MRGISLEESLEQIAHLERIDGTEDLNKKDADALARKKMVMDETFERNRKQIGDGDFKYDVDRDFEYDVGEVETCDWDEGEDEDF